MHEEKENKQYPIESTPNLLGAEPRDVREDDQFLEAVRDQFRDAKNLPFITELSEKDISLFERMTIFHDWADGKTIIPQIQENKMRLRVSKERKGRGEFFTLFKNQNHEYGSGEGSGWMGRLFGKKQPPQY